MERGADPPRPAAGIKGHSSVQSLKSERSAPGEGTNGPPPPSPPPLPQRPCAGPPSRLRRKGPASTWPATFQPSYAIELLADVAATMQPIIVGKVDEMPKDQQRVDERSASPALPPSDGTLGNVTAPTPLGAPLGGGTPAIAGGYVREFNPVNGLPYGRGRGGKRPSKPAYPPGYEPPTAEDVECKDNMRAQSMAAAMLDGGVDDDGITPAPKVVSSPSVYDLQAYYGQGQGATRTLRPTPVDDADMDGVPQYLTQEEHGVNTAVGSIAKGSQLVGSQPRPGPPKSKASGKGKAKAKPVPRILRPKKALRKKVGAAVAAPAMEAAAAQAKAIESVAEHLSTCWTEADANAVDSAVMEASASTMAAAKDALVPPSPCRSLAALPRSPRSPPPPGAGSPLNRSGTPARYAGGAAASSAAVAGAPGAGAAGDGVPRASTGALFTGVTDKSLTMLYSGIRKAMMETTIPLTRAVAGLVTVVQEMERESAGVIQKVDTMGTNHERVAKAVNVMKMEHDKQLAVIVSMLVASVDGSASGSETDAEQPMGSCQRSTKGRKSRNKRRGHSKPMDGSGFKAMEKVRRAFRRVLMKHLAETETTKLVYPSTKDTWDMLIAAAVEALSVTAEEAKDFLMDFILMPTRGDPTEAVSRRASVPLLRVKPHLIQTIKERVVMAFLRALSLSKGGMTEQLATSWLVGNAYMESELGFRAIMEALKDFFLYLGASERVTQGGTIGSGTVIECALGHFALVSSLVRSFLELLAGLRPAGRNGTKEGLNEYWVAEVGRADAFLARDTAVHNGLRLLDGDVEQRAVFEDDVEEDADMMDED